jgi:hypothetical protein
MGYKIRSRLIKNKKTVSVLLAFSANMESLHAGAHHPHLLHTQWCLVNDVHFLEGDAELPQTVQWLTVRQPAVDSVRSISCHRWNHLAMLLGRTNVRQGMQEVDTERSNRRSNQPVYLSGLSQWIVDDVHVQLNHAVNVIPVVNHFVLVSAKTNHHPHWQFFKWTHRSYIVVIAGQ